MKNYTWYTHDGIPRLLWENEDGSTDVANFLRLYAENDNVYWVAGTGHVMNVLDELIAENERLANILLHTSTRLAQIEMRDVLDALGDA